MKDLRLTPQNADILRRLDGNGDGMVTRAEVQEAFRQPGNGSRVGNEAVDLSPEDRQVMRGLLSGQFEAVSLTFGGQQVGHGEGKVEWSAARAGLAAEQANQVAPLGTVGQERPSAMLNNDCGPAVALYLHDRREQLATGHAPRRTHGEADAMIRQVGQLDSRRPGEATDAGQMATIQNRWFANAGGRHYRFDSHAVHGREQILPTLQQGLAKDPGGVMVRIVATYNAADTQGTSHWISVTGIDNGQVHYYDPDGPDGGQHEHTMPLDQLVSSVDMDIGTASEGNTAFVWGEAEAEDAARGNMAPGQRIGQEVDVTFNDDITITAPMGVYGDHASASRRCEALAAQGIPTVVMREHGSFAVYQTSNFVDLTGGRPEFAHMDSRVTDAYWQQSGGVQHQALH